MEYNAFTQIGTNLYKIGFNQFEDKRYFRLFGTGITPNGCWIINPKMVELKDIDIASGQDVYGTEIIFDNITGTVSASGGFREYIKY